MMQQAEFMDQLVADLIERYEAAVLATGLLRLALRMKGHGLLIMEERLKRLQMSVCYLLFDAEGHPVPEPEILFYLDEGDHWIPYEFRRLTAGHHAFAILDAAAGELLVTDAPNQLVLAQYADHWAELLRAQGWLERSVKDESSLSAAGL